MIHIVSPLLLSYDLSHVLLTTNQLGGFSTLGAPVKTGEGFRSAAARIVGEANGPETDPDDWRSIYVLRVPQAPDKKVLYHAAKMQSDGFIGMELKEGSGFWVPTRAALDYSTKEVLSQGGFFHDALLAQVIPIAVLTLTTDFRNLG